MASSRIGKNTGPGSWRSTASTSARIRISTSATKKILMFNTKAWPTVAKYARNSAGSKKACLTFGHPDELMTISVSPANTTTVLPSATHTLPTDAGSIWAPRRGSLLPRSISLLQDRGADLVGQPGLLQLGERPVGRERCHGLVD